MCAGAGRGSSCCLTESAAATSTSAPSTTEVALTSAKTSRNNTFHLGIGRGGGEAVGVTCFYKRRGKFIFAFLIYLSFTERIVRIVVNILFKN